MIKLLKFYLKDNLLSFIITTVIATAISFVMFTTADFVLDYSGEVYLNTSAFSYFPALLLVLSTVSPMAMLSFKMKKIGIDKFYAFPIKKNMLYLARYILGLLIMFIPYVVSFLIAFIIVLCKENLFSYGYIFLFFIALIPCAIAIYTIIFFTFYCQNTVIDGALIVGIVVCIIPFVLLAISSMITQANGDYHYDLLGASDEFFLYSPLYTVASIFTTKIKGGSVTVDFPSTISLIVLFVGAVGAVGAFLFKSKYEKPENALERSDSYFGYKVFVPVIATACVLCFLEISGWILGVVVLFIGFLIYRRTFKLNRASWLTLIIFAAVSLVFIIVFQSVI